MAKRRRKTTPQSGLALARSANPRDFHGDVGGFHRGDSQHPGL
jgi:hypothetical protein